jgi:hypothetical protein
MSEEHKLVDFKIEESKLHLTVDPNRDGQAVVSLLVDLAEIPDEVLSALGKGKKEEA